LYWWVLWARQLLPQPLVFPMKKMTRLKKTYERDG
jgi:hypothetical protein